jgi:hypothetical protein
VRCENVVCRPSRYGSVLNRPPVSYRAQIAHALGGNENCPRETPPSADAYVAMVASVGTIGSEGPPFSLHFFDGRMLRLEWCGVKLPLALSLA